MWGCKSAKKLQRLVGSLGERQPLMYISGCFELVMDVLEIQLLAGRLEVHESKGGSKQIQN